MKKCSFNLTFLAASLSLAWTLSLQAETSSHAPAQTNLTLPKLSTLIQDKKLNFMHPNVAANYFAQQQRPEIKSIAPIPEVKAEGIGVVDTNNPGNGLEGLKTAVSNLGNGQATNKDSTVKDPLNPKADSSPTPSTTPTSNPTTPTTPTTPSVDPAKPSEDKPTEQPTTPAVPDVPATPATEPTTPSVDPTKPIEDKPTVDNPAEQPTTPAVPEVPTTPATEPTTPSVDPAKPIENKPAEQPTTPTVPEIPATPSVDPTKPTEDKPTVDKPAEQPTTPVVPTTPAAPVTEPTTPSEEPSTSSQESITPEQETKDTSSEQTTETTTSQEENPSKLDGKAHLLNEINVKDLLSVNLPGVEIRDYYYLKTNREQNYTPNPQNEQLASAQANIYVEGVFASKEAIWKSGKTNIPDNYKQVWNEVTESFAKPKETLDEYKTILHSLELATNQANQEVFQAYSLSQYSTTSQGTNSAYAFLTNFSKVHQFRAFGIPVSPPNVAGFWPNPAPLLNNYYYNVDGTYSINNLDEQALNPFVALIHHKDATYVPKTFRALRINEFPTANAIYTPPSVDPVYTLFYTGNFNVDPRKGLPGTVPTNQDEPLQLGPDSNTTLESTEANKPTPESANNQPTPKAPVKQPQAPTTPVDPAKPTTPTEQPTPPSEPAKPTEPTNPTTPAEPSKPNTDPTKPVTDPAPTTPSNNPSTEPAKPSDTPTVPADTPNQPNKDNNPSPSTPPADEPTKPDTTKLG